MGKTINEHPDLDKEWQVLWKNREEKGRERVQVGWESHSIREVAHLRRWRLSRDVDEMWRDRKRGQSTPGRENYKGRDPEMESDSTQFTVLGRSWLGGTRVGWEQPLVRRLMGWTWWEVTVASSRLAVVRVRSTWIWDTFWRLCK